MAEEELQKPTPTEEVPEKSKSNLLMIIVILLIVVLIIIVGMMFIMQDSGEKIQTEKPVAEYVVKEKMYQLKDGSYLRLSFSIVVDANKIPEVKEIIETQSPGRLPDSIHMLLGNKNREDLISGSHKREAFARELKKSLEEQVFRSYNKDKNPDEQIKIYDIYISDYVTQSG